MKQELTFKKDEQAFAAPIKIRETFSLDDNIEVPEMFKDLDLEKGRYFWGYANIATPDSMGDKFTLDALTQISLGLTCAPYNKIFLFHNYKDIAIGKIIYTMVDGLGLIILAKLNEAHQRAEEIMQSLGNGSLDGFSMAGNFIRVVSEFDESTGEFINLVLEATAKEVTLTSIPAHPGASVMGTFRKSMEKYNKRFLKAYKNGEEIKSDKYKKDTSLEENMEDKDSKKTDDDNKPQDDSATDTSDDKKSDNEPTNDDADVSKDADKSDDSNDDSKDDAKSNSNKDSDNSPDSVDDDSDKKDSPDVDKTVVELKEKITELEKENHDLKLKLSGYEKAEKIGYEKAMKKKAEGDKDSKRKGDEPFRKSVKTPADDKPAKSSSTPMLSWLKK